MIGQTISRYRIVDKLGEGGMGVVYQAEDTDLGRPVALKFLAAHLLNDDEAKQRFLREARAAAAITHPNICHVYEVGEADGKTFLAMAYLEGESLEDRIAKGPLPLRDALDIGRQIAEGLEAAHEKGIVHRDIKPANIMVDAKGRATILDFGLSRLTEASKLTRPDQTVGTAAYMSPEQMQGGEVDQRTDIWALGCVLYEMVAGVRPFPGQYDQALAYEIVNQDPEPVTSVRAGVPMEFEFTLGKCLQKDHSKRYDRASELEKDLRSVSDKLRSARSTATRTNTKVFGPIVPPIKTASEHDGPSVVLRKRLPWAIASVAVLASLMVTFDAADRPAREGLQASFEVHGPAAVGIVGGTVSPDGKILGYRPFDDVSRIWLRGLDDRPIKTIDGYPRELSWSPDSKALAFISGGAIKRFELAEDQPRMLCDACDLPREITAGTAWSRDGQIYIGFLDGPMRKISTGGGLLTEALPLEEGELSQQFPAVLPDGENVLYVSIRKDPGLSGIYLRSLSDSGRGRRVHPTVRPFRYLETGHLLVHTEENAIESVPFDFASGLVGQSTMLAADVGGYRLETTAASADGRVILIRNSSTEPGARLTVYSRNGDRLRVLTQTRGASHVELSNDQKRLLYEFGPTLWVMELELETTSRLTFGGNAGPGVWSADDSEVYFYESGVENGRGIYSIASDGAGEGSRILDSAAHHLHASPDGKTLIYEDGTLDTANFRILDLIDSDHSTPYLESGIIRHPQISPDSRFVAYQAEDKGIWEIYVKRYPAGEGTWQISSGGGMQPRWRGDGKEIYYVTPEGQVRATEISLTENAVTQGKTEDLFRYRIGTIEGKSLNVSRDGQWFVVRELQPDAKPITGRILLNWPLGKL